MLMICSSGKKDDVLNGLLYARKTKTNITPLQGISILQVGKVLYKKLERNFGELVFVILNKRTAKHK